MSIGSDDQHPAPVPDADGTRGSGPAASPSPKGRSDETSPAKPSVPVGQFLRDAYRDTLDEGVPDDMMDLLRKLD